MAQIISRWASSSVPISESKCSEVSQTRIDTTFAGHIHDTGTVDNSSSALFLDKVTIYQKTRKRSRDEAKKDCLEYKTMKEPQFVVDIMLNIPAVS